MACARESGLSRLCRTFWKVRFRRASREADLYSGGLDYLKPRLINFNTMVSAQGADGQEKASSFFPAHKAACKLWQCVST
jgi:hypothetical protein